MNAEIPAFSPDVLAESLAALPEPKGHVVALSGGGDSTALLLALRELEVDIPLRAIHVGHGLHPDAPAWAKRCRTLCRELEVNLEVIEVPVNERDDGGLEAAAREARYAALEARLGAGEMLLTGHHRDDQAETMLLHLMRGSGLDGLSGMAPCRPFGAGWLARPLLAVPRDALRNWLQARGCHWVEDPDNANPARGRNYLRHRVVPLLEARWPGAVALAARGADNLRDARSALESWARKSLSLALTPAGDGLRLDGLRELDGPCRRQVLRLWLRDAGMPAPDSRQLAELAVQAFIHRDDAGVRVGWPGCEVRRFRGVLYAMPPLEKHDAGVELEWDTREVLELPRGLGRLSVQGGPGGPPAWKLRVGFRQGGERIRLPGRDHHTDLKSLFQDLGIPPWERNRVPLVFDDGEVAAVADWQFSCAFAQRLRDAGAGMTWEGT